MTNAGVTNANAGVTNANAGVTNANAGVTNANTGVTNANGSSISPRKDLKLFGLDQTTVITSIVVPLLLAVFSVWLTAKWRDKLRVRVVPTLKPKEFEQLAELYCERIPDYERIPPNHFQAFFHREYSAKSVRDFKRRIGVANTPTHLLLVAQNSRAIRGFLKAIFVPDTQCLFVAYLVTAQGGNQEDLGIAQQLISLLFDICHNSTLKSIVCEICTSEDTQSAAKARLFRQYASIRGVKLHRITAKYLQPEICSFDEGDSKLTDASLYIVYVNNHAQNAWRSISRDDYEQLVLAIYKNVYLLSYALAEPQLTEEYRTFLHKVTQDLFAGLRKKSIELK